MSHSSGIQIWRSSWPLFLSDHFMDSSCVGIVEQRMQCMEIPCISLNLPLHLAAVGCGLYWNLEAQVSVGIDKDVTQNSMVTCSILKRKWKDCRLVLRVCMYVLKLERMQLVVLCTMQLLYVTDIDCVAVSRTKWMGLSSLTFLVGGWKYVLSSNV